MKERRCTAAIAPRLSRVNFTSMCWGPAADGEDRAGRFPHQLVGDRPLEAVEQARRGPHAQNNQLGLDLGGHVKNGGSYPAELDPVVQVQSIGFSANDV